MAILYLEETGDARKTRALVEESGRQCLAMRGDVRSEAFCRRAVSRTIKEFQRLDVLINNAAVQYPQDDPAKIKTADLKRTFETNVFGAFYLTIAALPTSYERLNGPNSARSVSSSRRSSCSRAWAARSS